MEDIPSSTLRRRRAQLLKQMPALETLLRGSLIERYKRCGKPGCKCADGPGHGPKYYLSVSFPGRRPQMDYVCEFPAYRSHFVFGVMAPPDFRRNGATAFSA
jgi:Family of unknown function (DUF6788)